MPAQNSINPFFDISSISAFTEWMNKEEKFLKLTTVSSEIVPGLDQAATSSPNEAPTTTAHSQHLTTTAKDTFPESDKKNEEVLYNYFPSQSHLW